METPAPDRLASDLRTNRVIWLAVVAGVVLFTAVMIYLLATGDGGSPESGSLFFYANAALNVAAIAAAFAVQRSLDERLAHAGTYEEAALLIRQRGLIALAIMEASAFFAIVALFLTGEWLNLAFVVPFFAFAALFFPTEARYAYWLSLWQGRR
jgi:hypothetical protein